MEKTNENIAASFWTKCWPGWRERWTVVVVAVIVMCVTCPVSAQNDGNQNNGNNNEVTSPSGTNDGTTETAKGQSRCPKIMLALMMVMAMFKQNETEYCIHPVEGNHSLNSHIKYLQTNLEINIPMHTTMRYQSM